MSNDFASFDYSTWSNRQFDYAVTGYSKDLLAVYTDTSKIGVDGPPGGYIHIILSNLQMPTSTKPQPTWSLTHERCSANLVAG